MFSFFKKFIIPVIVLIGLVSGNQIKLPVKKFENNPHDYFELSCASIGSATNMVCGLMPQSSISIQNYMNAQYYKHCTCGLYDNFQFISLIKDRSLRMRLPNPHFCLKNL